MARLETENIAYLHVSSQGALSKYRPDDVARAIYVRKQPAVGADYLLPLAEATRLYDRYADATVLERLYVPSEDAERAAADLAYGLSKPAHTDGSSQKLLPQSA